MYLFLQGLSNEHRCIWEFTFSLFISLIYDLSVAMPLFGMSSRVWMQDSPTKFRLELGLSLKVLS
uniref:Uncharacterized protein n=1 Tax=Helianthus annuus TaxID=4232 RepID=A0A251VJW2_HELAN